MHRLPSGRTRKETKRGAGGEMGAQTMKAEFSFRSGNEVPPLLLHKHTHTKVAKLTLGWNRKQGGKESRDGSIQSLTKKKNEREYGDIRDVGLTVKRYAKTGGGKPSKHRREEGEKLIKKRETVRRHRNGFVKGKKQTTTKGVPHTEGIESAVSAIIGCSSLCEFHSTQTMTDHANGCFRPPTAYL